MPSAVGNPIEKALLKTKGNGLPFTPTFKYANRVDACIEAMQKCLKEGKPEEVDPNLVY